MRFQYFSSLVPNRWALIWIKVELLFNNIWNNEYFYAYIFTDFWIFVNILITDIVVTLFFFFLIKLFYRLLKIDTIYLLKFLSINGMLLDFYIIKKMLNARNEFYLTFVKYIYTNILKFRINFVKNK